MRENAKSVGAVIGFCGGQLFALALFVLFSEQCCVAQVCVGEANCLFGQTFGSFWAIYGTIFSLVAIGLGMLIASAGGD